MRPRFAKNLMHSSTWRLYGLAALVLASSILVYIGIQLYRQEEIRQVRFESLQKTLTPPLLEAARQRQRSMIKLLFQGLVDGQELSGLRFIDNHEGWQESYFQPGLPLQESEAGYRFIILDQRADGFLHTLTVEMFLPSPLAQIFSSSQTWLLLLLCSSTALVLVQLVQAQNQKLFVRPLRGLHERILQLQLSTPLGSDTTLKALEKVEGEFEELENSYIEMLARLQVSQRDATLAREEVDRLKHRAVAEAAERQKSSIDHAATATPEAKLAALGEMAGSIAHEINNPLAILVGRSAQLRKFLSPSIADKPQLEGIIGSMEKTIYRIQELVFDLETMANRPSQEELKPLQLKKFLQRVEEAAMARYPAQGLEFIFHGAQDYSIAAREVELTQAIFYLIENAVEAAQYGTEAWVKIELGPISQDTITLLVIDSGPGIPSDIRSQIFQPFFSTKDVGQGRGTGLSLAKSIIEAGRGLVAFDYHANCTTLSIVLPRYKDHAKAAA